MSFVTADLMKEFFTPFSLCMNGIGVASDRISFQFSFMAVFSPAAFRPSEEVGATQTSLRMIQLSRTGFEQLQRWPAFALKLSWPRNACSNILEILKLMHPPVDAVATHQRISGRYRTRAEFRDGSKRRLAMGQPLPVCSDQRTSSGWPIGPARANKRQRPSRRPPTELPEQHFGFVLEPPR
jgi:hypothetical protein